MKKIFGLLLFLYAFLIYAQNGKVGINTANPTRILDLNGNLRVRTLEDKNADTNYNNVLIADNNGNVDFVSKSKLLQSTAVLFNVNTLPALNLLSTNTTPQTISIQTVTLTKAALVQINFSVPVTLTNSSSDGRLKILRTHLFVNNVDVVRATNTYTNTTSTGTNLTGIFYNTGSYYINLAAGTHTIELKALCFNDFACTQGGNFVGSVFQAIAIYNEN